MMNEVMITMEQFQTIQYIAENIEDLVKSIFAVAGILIGIGISIGFGLGANR